MVSLKELKEWYKTHEGEVWKDFCAFLRFQSIGTDPHFKEQTHQTAHWLCNYMLGIGLKADVWQTPGHPVVFGYYEAGPEYPTLMIYNHYDVQPVDPLELWISPPFEPTLRGGKVFARGAVDNKGQCFYALTAVKAALQLAKKLQMNLKVFIEGEEESGSEGTSALIRERKEELKADDLLVLDFDIPSLSAPGVTVGMRGLITLEVECENARADLHSGTHGGIALNPNRALATLLAKLWDEKGRVTLPHFYDDVEKMDATLIDMTFNEVEYRKRFGVGALCREEGYSLKESNGVRPVLEINGMSGGYTGEGVKTIIPAKARAKLSCRLVPHQDPQKILRALKEYFERNIPPGMRITFKERGGAPAYRSRLNSPLIGKVRSAYEEVFQKPCSYCFCGASVPIIVELAAATGGDVALMGMGLAEDDIHAPNEHFGMDRFELGFLVMGRILTGGGDAKQ